MPLITSESQLIRHRAATGGWWLPSGISAANVIAAYAAKGAASQSASYVNLAHPGTNDATEIVAPTWAAATGWGSTGAAGLSTGIVPTNNQQWSIFVRFSGATTGTKFLFGFYTSETNAFGILPHYSFSAHYRNGTLFNEGAGLTGGVIGFAGRKGYRNGAATTGTIPAGASGTNTQEIFLMCFNNAGSILYGYTGSVQAAVFFDATLNAAQALELSNNMAAL